MKYFRKTRIILIGLVSFLLCGLLTSTTVVSADTTTDNQITNLLDMYEIVFSDPSAISEYSFTSQMWDLIKDRRAYYDEFFTTALHASLTEIESEFDKQNNIDK